MASPFVFGEFRGGVEQQPERKFDSLEPGVQLHKIKLARRQYILWSSTTGGGKHFTKVNECFDRMLENIEAGRGVGTGLLRMKNRRHGM